MIKEPHLFSSLLSVVGPEPVLAVDRFHESMTMKKALQLDETRGAFFYLTPWDPLHHTCKKRRFLQLCFPMFVPSLSW
jgi:hypothetical protein